MRVITTPTMPQHHRHSARTPLIRAAAVSSAATTSATPPRVAKPTLYDIPVSNHGARMLDIDIQPPTTIGGLKSDAYLACNPQGKMPLLLLPDGTSIPESEVIVQYLLRACRSQGPSLVASSPELQVQSDLATRVMDCYINAVQGCLYKEGDVAMRAAQVKQIAEQLDVLEGVVIGPFCAGQEMTSGDGCMLATIAWLEYILPTKFGWNSIFTNRPKLAAWWDAMQADDVGARITAELQDGLRAWDDGGRWEQRGIAQQIKDTSHRWSW